MEINIRSKSEYLKQPDWQQLYLLTRNWQSDMRFYEDKVRFFRHLVNQRLLWVQDEQIVKDLQNLHNKLIDTLAQCKRINDTLQAHIMHYQQFTENPFSQNEDVMRAEHEMLESDFSSFTRYFRALKKEVVTLAEKAIDTGQTPTSS